MKRTPPDSPPAGQPQADQQAHPPELGRRDFLKRMAAASALALAAGGVGLALRDTTGPPAAPARKTLETLGDFRTPAQKDAPGKLAIVRGTDRAAMFDLGVKALGGMGAFIAPGDHVLIKVNAAFASPAALGATTNPELLAAVAEQCRKAGATKVLVTDNPINSPEACFEISGLAQAARQSGASVLLPSAGLFAPLSLPGGSLLRSWPVLAGAFKGVTKVIAVSPVKDHHRAGASMTLKNFYGFLGGRRNVFHQDINTIVAELSMLLKPTLAVLDGTSCMMTNGPTGGSLSDLKAANTLVVATDPVAADAVGLELLGRTVDDVPYLRMAQAAGAGTADYWSLAPKMLEQGA